jgi:hypothetical protein
MRYHFDLDEMTPEEEAERFRYFTRAQFEAAFRASGLPDRCTDPGTLRGAAEIHVAEERRIAAKANPAA